MPAADRPKHAFGEGISVSLKDRFAWHPQARLIGGPRVELQQANLQRAMSGQPFRIGGTGDLAAGAGAFETLTSGSTAAPRRIVRSMASWIRSFQINAKLFGIGPGVRVAVLGGLEQSLSLYGAVEALYLGADLQMQAARAQLIYASPAQLRLLVAAGAGLPDLAQIVVGGSKLDAKLRADLAQICGAKITEFYGAAEASFITISDAATPQDSVGRPYPGVELDLRAGQIWVRSPYVFDRYAGADQGGAVWQDDWLSVGEMGRMQEGFLYLSGRAGRMVTVADHNVFPEEIEAVIGAMEGVAQVAVLPRQDDFRGVHMVAVVQGDAAQEGAILAGARAVFGAMKAPKSVIWRGEWPLLPSGKTDLRMLQSEVDAWR